MMKANSIRIAVGMSVLAMLVGFAPEAEARACSAARATGVWGYTNSGSIPGRGVFAFVSVGRAILEASGRLSGNQTTSLNGALLQESVDGSFTVNPDCTGTAVVNVFQGKTLVRTSLLDLVFVDDMNEARAIILTTGTAISASLRRVSSEGDE